MRRWTEPFAVVLLVSAALLWVGAKVHFFTRFGATTLEGYVQEHWPFWAGMAVVAVLVLAVGAIERRRES